MSRQHNALRVIAAMADLQLVLALDPMDITCPCPPFMVLLVHFLFERLPAYLPTTSVDFEGTALPHLTGMPLTR